MSQHGDLQGRPARPRVGLLVTCLVDLFRPNVGFSAVKLLEDAGCAVEIPLSQTCCGQPAMNNGDRLDAASVAKQVIEAFERFDFLVVPSGSCAGTIRVHYPELFADKPQWLARARDLAEKTHELLSFLADVMNVESVNARFEGLAAYHDSCSGLRELGVKAQPRKLLASVAGLKLAELNDAEVCCGFGGTFCVKYPAISERLVSDKLADIERTGADTVLAGDLGCLLNIAGRARRQGIRLKLFHAAEVLANHADRPAIAEPEEKK